MSEDGYRIHYAKSTYGQEEQEAVNEVLSHPERLVKGPYTEKFESQIASLFGKDHGIMVNSGSSANLLAAELIDADPGAEVITPIVTFSTTIAPLVQKGFVPVFTDIGVGDYQLNIDQVEQAITEETVAILVPSLVGNVPNYHRLRDIAVENDLLLIEDSADTLGATIDDEPTGAYTDITTTSFYASHVITSFGSGGMVSVDDDAWKRRLMKLRGWGRKSAANEVDDIDERLVTELDGVQYDSKFVFDEIGYNFLPIEAMAAFGIEQVKKLPEFKKIRRRNFEAMFELYSRYDDWFVLPKERNDVDTTWLAFPVTVREDAPFERKELVKHLENNRIQTRSLWTGNILKHPGFKQINARLPFEEYPKADTVMRNSFVIGTHQSIDHSDLEYIRKTVTEFLRQY
ncbi:aminotransferase class I/II-fold pyridoxal phosphate-dependent enzyme [Halobellus rubicundus]|uniref:Aminotransferase class I/II-fold pyridoxal phosphate-dependent enzyme n=1 Tax=Halobellus rubicundus TaxID=2996466 RepID=A0ABD5MF80_9EURY